MWKLALPAFGTRAAGPSEGGSLPYPMPLPPPPRSTGGPTMTKEQAASALRTTLRLQQAILRLAGEDEHPSRGECIVIAREIEEELRSLAAFRLRLVQFARGTRLRNLPG